MANLQLPLVHLTDPLQMVLSNMRRMRVSGAVCEVGGKTQLIETADVVIELSRNPEATLADLRSTLRTPPPETIEIVRATASPVAEMPELVYDSPVSLKHTGRHAPPEKIVTVLVHSKELRSSLSASPFACFCSKHHEPVTGQNGDDCPNGDGGKVCCAG